MDGPPVCRCSASSSSPPEMLCSRAGSRRKAADMPWSCASAGAGVPWAAWNRPRQSAWPPSRREEIGGIHTTNADEKAPPGAGLRLTLVRRIFGDALRGSMGGYPLALETNVSHCLSRATAAAPNELPPPPMFSTIIVRARHRRRSADERVGGLRASARKQCNSRDASEEAHDWPDHPAARQTHRLPILSPKAAALVAGSAEKE